MASARQAAAGSKPAQPKAAATKAAPARKTAAKAPADEAAPRKRTVAVVTDPDDADAPPIEVGLPDAAHDGNQTVASDHVLPHGI